MSQYDQDPWDDLDEPGGRSRRRPRLGWKDSPLGSLSVGRLVLGAALVGFAVMLLLLAATTTGSRGVPTRASGPAGGLKWPWLIETLASGNAERILQQESDWRALSLLYMWDMTQYLSELDSDVSRVDYVCYTRLYHAETKGKLTSVAFTNLGPSVISDLKAALSGSQPAIGSLAERFPYLAELLGDIATEVPDGIFDQAIFAYRIRSIIQDRAKQDTITLIHRFGCASGGKSDRVFRTMYALLDQYSKNGFRGL